MVDDLDVTESQVLAGRITRPGQTHNDDRHGMQALHLHEEQACQLVKITGVVAVLACAW
ncbi:MAG TPA: hypothetical protein VIV12_05510 [Streptosporangiaceae bacterium]